jgi:hypothetical protein
VFANPENQYRLSILVNNNKVATIALFSPHPLFPFLSILFSSTNLVFGWFLQFYRRAPGFIFRPTEQRTLWVISLLDFAGYRILR